MNLILRITTMKVTDKSMFIEALCSYIYTCYMADDTITAVSNLLDDRYVLSVKTRITRAAYIRLDLDAAHAYDNIVRVVESAQFTRFHVISQDSNNDRHIASYSAEDARYFLLDTIDNDRFNEVLSVYVTSNISGVPTTYFWTQPDNIIHSNIDMMSVKTIDHEYIIKQLVEHDIEQQDRCK